MPISKPLKGGQEATNLDSNDVLFSCFNTANGFLFRKMKTGSVVGRVRARSLETFFGLDEPGRVTEASVSMSILSYL